MRERSFLRTIKRNLDLSFSQPNWANNLTGGDVFTFYFFSALPTCSSLMSFLFSFLICNLSMSHLSINPYKSQRHTHKNHRIAFFPSLSFEKLRLGKFKPHKNGLTKPGASKLESPPCTAVSSWVCQISATSSGTLGYHLGLKPNTTDTMKLIFLPHLLLLWRRYQQEKEEKKRKALYQVTRVTLGILRMLLVLLFVVAWATTPRVRLQSSTETGLPGF